MTLFGHLLRLAAPSALLLMAALPAALPVRAGEAEIAFLQGYVGNWRGSGTVTGGAEPEAFTCRMQVTKGNQGKVNYAGRCSLVGLNLSVAGTIAYFDAKARYEAAMTSNAGFSGLAIGRAGGGGVVFDLRERNVDEEGRDMTITSQVTLRGDTVTVGFDVVFSETGERLRATVPFRR